MLDTLLTHACVDFFLWMARNRYKEVNEEDAPRFLWCVEWDAKYLRKRIGMPRSERNADPLYTFLVEKYRNAYCPHESQLLWNDENKLRYDKLRPTIDDVLIRLGET